MQETKLSYATATLTPHSSPEKGFPTQPSIYPQSSVMYPSGNQQIPPRTSYTPPNNSTRQLRTPETSRVRFRTTGPVTNENGNRSFGLGMKRKCASEGCLSSKCYIREISKGLDKMIIKVKTPPPSPEMRYPKWSNHTPPYQVRSCNDSDNTMQCFPHSELIKHKNKLISNSPPSSLSHLQSLDAMNIQFPETNSPPSPNSHTNTTVMQNNDIVAHTQNGLVGAGIHGITTNCSRKLWSVQEDEDENGFIMGMDYTQTTDDNDDPRKNNNQSSTHSSGHMRNERFVPKRVIQLRNTENGIKAPHGIFVRDAVFYKANIRPSGTGK